MKDDVYFLKQASEEGNKVPKPYNFGAVLVKDGQIIAADHNHVAELNDPSAHDGISVLRKAGQKLKAYNFDGYTMYCSHEPCFMCVNAAAWAHIKRIVYSNPAKENKDFKYAFDDMTIEEYAQKLPRPLEVELIRLD